MIPTLHTTRLTLRAPTMADYTCYAAIMAAPRATCLGGPFDTPAIWGLYCHDLACWTLFGHGALKVDLRETRQTIGQVGLNAGPLFPEPAFGWYLFHGPGRGYATEAAFALPDWGFVAAGLSTFVSYTDPSNTASIAVTRCLGSVLDADAPRRDDADLVWPHQRRAQ